MILITMRIILKRQRKIKFLKNCLLTFTSNVVLSMGIHTHRFHLKKKLVGAKLIVWD